jgi:hypothetical protein
VGREKIEPAVTNSQPGAFQVLERDERCWHQDRTAVPAFKRADRTQALRETSIGPFSAV